MNHKFISGLVVTMGILLFSVTNSFSFSSAPAAVDAACGTVVIGGDCSVCHPAGIPGPPNPAKDAYLAGGTALTDFFCLPAGPTCTDNDNDTYAIEGGDCGPIDCDDTNVAINPGAEEKCGDTADNNCNGNIDERCRLSCPAGARSVIKEIRYNRADHRKLVIKGRSFVPGQSAAGTTITIIDTDTGETLKDGIVVMGSAGIWRANIKGVSPMLRRITIVASNGCSQIERLDRSIYQ